jgi:hypothetical protein
MTETVELRRSAWPAGMAPRQAVVPSKRAGRNGFEPVCEILSCVGILSSSGKGEALASELGGVGVTGSNQSTNDIRKLADLAMQRWGRIDVLGHGPAMGRARRFSR